MCGADSAEPRACGHTWRGRRRAGEQKRPAQIRIAEKKISTAVITHMAKNRVRRCRAMRRGSTCGHIRAPNSKTDGQVGLGRLAGVDPRD
jgi:hypothetical protein